MLRHACGFKLANDGQDTRAQHYLGHQNIQHSVRYTELSPERTLAVLFLTDTREPLCNTCHGIIDRSD
jgi:site-specific recombinase XerD